jgi:hypothetical protein
MISVRGAWDKSGRYGLGLRFLSVSRRPLSPNFKCPVSRVVSMGRRNTQVVPALH